MLCCWNTAGGTCSPVKDGSKPCCRCAVSTGINGSHDFTQPSLTVRWRVKWCFLMTLSLLKNELDFSAGWGNITSSLVSYSSHLISSSHSLLNFYCSFIFSQSAFGVSGSPARIVFAVLSRLSKHALKWPRHSQWRALFAVVNVNLRMFLRL